jgi:hypothetical protein
LNELVKKVQVLTHNYETISILIMFLTLKLLNKMLRVLNVAEKNDAAKSIAKIMSKSSNRMVTNKSYLSFPNCKNSII